MSIKLLQEENERLRQDLERANAARCQHGWRGTVPENGQQIVTPCPECGARSLFIGSGGHLTCARVPHGQSQGCTNPSPEDVVDKLKAAVESLRAERAAILPVARSLVARIEEVYKEEYMQKAAAKEPECMLAFLLQLRELTKEQ